MIAVKKLWWCAFNCIEGGITGIMFPFQTVGPVAMWACSQDLMAF